MILKVVCDNAHRVHTEIIRSYKYMKMWKMECKEKTGWDMESLFVLEKVKKIAKKK